MAAKSQKSHKVLEEEEEENFREKVAPLCHGDRDHDDNEKLYLSKFNMGQDLSEGFLETVVFKINWVPIKNSYEILVKVILRILIRRKLKWVMKLNTRASDK